MANQPHPRNIYPQISSSLDTQQYVGNKASEVNGQFEFGRSTWTEKWAVNQAEIQLFVDDVMGYATNGGVPELQHTGVVDCINRRLPARSYQFPQMFASAITGMEALAPTGQNGGLATYKQMRATIQFETPPYDVLTNAQAANRGDVTDKPTESWRYVIWNRQPATEFARTPKDAFRYPSGPFRAGHSPITGSGGVLFLITKYRITANWIQVPASWITNNGFTFPTLDAAVGKVNNSQFLGYPKGTMLFESYSPTPRTMPVSPNVILGDVFDNGYAPRCYDVELKFLYFNPEPVYQAAGQVAPLGHNLVYEPQTGLWMRAIKISVSGAAGENTPANWLYPEYNLAKIFMQNLL